MSRQQGRRPKPKPERRAEMERYSRKARRGREKLPKPERPERAVSWPAVLAGILLSIVVYGLTANAVVLAGDGAESAAIWNAIGASLLVPVVLGIVGFLSRAETPWRTAIVASGAVVGLFVVGTLAARDIGTGYVLGMGVGAALAMRYDEDRHRRSWRMWTAVGLAVYTKLVYLLSPELSIVAAPLLPIAGVAIIDSVAARRTEAS